MTSVDDRRAIDREMLNEDRILPKLDFLNELRLQTNQISILSKIVGKSFNNITDLRSREEKYKKREKGRTKETR